MVFRGSTFATAGKTEDGEEKKYDDRGTTDSTTNVGSKVAG